MNNKDLTKTQTTILFLLYKYRFLHTYHIQHLLNHKNSTRINTWLTDLTEKQYLSRYYDEHTILKKPAVYALTKTARNTLKLNEQCNITLLNKIYREHQRSQAFINHCLLVGDIYLSLSTQQKTDTPITFETKNTLIDYEYFPFKTMDAYFSININQTIKRYFTTIIDPNTKTYIIKGIVRRYMTYWHSDLWQENTDKPFPAILLICPDQSTKHLLARYVAKVNHEEQTDIHFYFATYDEVKKKQMRLA